jgi:hypothetical protein
MAPRKRGGHSGLSLKVTGDVVHRLASIRALWFAVYNDPDTSVHDVAAEFYSAVGQLLEGRSLEQMDFQFINKDRVLEHVREG